MSRIVIFAIIAGSSTAAFAGQIIPNPGASITGSAALLAAIGAVVGVKYLRNRRGK